MVRKLYIKEDLDSDMVSLKKSIKSDIRKVASVDPDVSTYEDLKHIDLNNRYLLVVIDRCERKGLDVDDCIDYVIQYAQTWLKRIDDEYKETDDYNKKVDALISIIDRFLNTNYTVIDKVENQKNIIWTVKAPEGADHDDCISFVDSVVSAVNGRYYGTGRGGSWSMWDILSNGVEFKAGWKDHSDDWEVKIGYRTGNFF